MKVSLGLFLNFGQIWGSFSYKIVPIKKSVEGCDGGGGGAGNPESRRNFIAFFPNPGHFV